MQVGHCLNGITNIVDRKHQVILQLILAIHKVLFLKKGITYTNLLLHLQTVRTTKIDATYLPKVRIKHTDTKHQWTVLIIGLLLTTSHKNTW